MRVRRRGAAVRPQLAQQILSPCVFRFTHRPLADYISFPDGVPSNRAAGMTEKFLDYPHESSLGHHGINPARFVEQLFILVALCVKCHTSVALHCAGRLAAVVVPAAEMTLLTKRRTRLTASAGVPGRRFPPSGAIAPCSNDGLVFFFLVVARLPGRAGR